MTQFDKRNISMMMDLYEMTMANGYFANQQKPQKVVFDVFYRKNPDQGGYAVFAGLEQVVEYAENLHFDSADMDYFRSLNLFSEEFLQYLKEFRFTGDIYAFPEGTVMYPNELVITVVAPLIDAQLIETAILTQVNHQSLIATKVSRIVRAAQGRSVSDFGARRAHNIDAAVYGARAAYIGGASGTATVMAGQKFRIPVNGTMAHSWVMYFKDEYEVFRRYAEVYPDNVVLLVDTYDVLHSGVPNAIRVAKEVLEPMNRRLKGVRLDSGDLAYLSKKVRKMLDDAGLEDCKIVVSNSLDEYTITSILNQGGKINSFGVGERLITAKSNSVFGAVYKISAVADLITGAEEEVDLTNPYRYVDPEKPWKNRHFENCTAKKLQKLIVKNGRRIAPVQSLKEIRAYVKRQLDTEIWPEEQRFENPHKHYLDMSPAYYEMKMNLLDEAKNL